MKRYTRGFTLIELLVVIAIIGILASVVLVSLQSARKKGNDSRVMSSVSQIRVALESNYSASNTYPDLISSAASRLAAPPVGGTNLATLVTDITSQQTSGGLAGVYGANAAGTLVANPTVVITKPNGTSGAAGYAIYATLPGAGTTFCIDSAGRTKNTATLPSTAGLVAALSDITAVACQ